MKAVVVPGNLGPEFDLGNNQPGKITLKLGQGLAKDPTGGLIFDPSTYNVGQLIKSEETETTLTYDSATTILTYTNEKGAISSIDLSALTTDLSIKGGSLDPTSLALTLTNDDPSQPDISINLSSLKAIVTLASDSVALSGTGEAATPLKAEVVLDPNVNNLLKSSATGLLVDGLAVASPPDLTVTDAFGNPLFEAKSA